MTIPCGKLVGVLTEKARKAKGLNEPFFFSCIIASWVDAFAVTFTDLQQLFPISNHDWIS